MYSDAEIDAAVAGGAISPGAAAALREFVARHRAASAADEEQFRLLTGFNDIFVGVAMLMALLALAKLAAQLGTAISAGVVGLTSWGLAEFFTRHRRMALPSILLLASFVGSAFLLGTSLADLRPGLVAPGRTRVILDIASGGALAVLAAWIHWQRFQVPITVAAGGLAASAAVLAVLIALIPALQQNWLVLLFAAGVILFALAMRWDMSDRQRNTRRADIAFWLHLASAPLIVHPVFALLGLLEGRADTGRAALAFALYVALALVALVVDRRALLVSALSYVLYATSTLVAAVGAVDAAFSLTALVVGSALLLLSAFWHGARRAVLRFVPPALGARMPAA